MSSPKAYRSVHPSPTACQLILKVEATACQPTNFLSTACQLILKVEPTACQPTNFLSTACQLILKVEATATLCITMH